MPVDDSETIDSGIVTIVTSPRASVTVTGNAAAFEVVVVSTVVAVVSTAVVVVSGDDVAVASGDDVVVSIVSAGLHAATKNSSAMRSAILLI